jgi:hypothetical protein
MYVYIFTAINYDTRLFFYLVLYVIYSSHNIYKEKPRKTVLVVARIIMERLKVECPPFF